MLVDCLTSNISSLYQSQSLSYLLSPDILVKKQAIAEFTSFRLIAGKVAIVTYWEESEFSYKGNENKDRAKLTAVLEKTEEGKWKPIHFHRGSG